MDSAIIIYHKNALTYYQHKWIIKCLESIEKQTYQNFDIFEVSYGDKKDEQSIIKYFNKLQDKKLFYFHEPMPDHSYAINFILDKVFAKNTKYKYCFNIHIDDFFDETRFERQVKIIKKFNYDLVSAQMYYIDENDNITKKMDRLAYTFVNPKKVSLKEQLIKEQEYITTQFAKNHNIIPHPCVCYTRRFWKMMRPYKHVLPKEDMEIFKRAAFNKDIRIHISKKFLLYYRIHEKQTCHINKKK